MHNICFIVLTVTKKKIAYGIARKSLYKNIQLWIIMGKNPVNRLYTVYPNNTSLTLI